MSRSPVSKDIVLGNTVPPTNVIKSVIACPRCVCMLEGVCVCVRVFAHECAVNLFDVLFLVRFKGEADGKFDRTAGKGVGSGGKGL